MTASSSHTLLAASGELSGWHEFRVRGRRCASAYFSEDW